MAEEESSGRAVQDPPVGLLREPKSLLHSVNARIGGYGRDLNAHESLLLADERGYLGKAIGYENLQQDISPRDIISLHWHPVRLLAKQSPSLYDDARKKSVDWAASRQLKSEKYDLFHGWSGSSLRSLRAAKKRRIPSVLEIPLWHTDKMRPQPVETSPCDTDQRTTGTLLERVFTVTTQQILEEYDLADLLLVPSGCAAQSFLEAGVPEEKLFLLGAGVDTELFRNDTPSELPSSFSAERPMRAVYCGMLTRRKGVHVLLQAWKKLSLPHAQLTLVGTVCDGLRPSLTQFEGPSIDVTGYLSCVDEVFRQNEANGLIVPPNDVVALANAIRRLYNSPRRILQCGRVARQRAEAELTWDHFRERLARAYDLVLRQRSTS